MLIGLVTPFKGVLTQVPLFFSALTSFLGQQRRSQLSLLHNSKISFFSQLASITAKLNWLQMLLKDLGIYLHHVPRLWCNLRMLLKDLAILVFIFIMFLVYGVRIFYNIFYILFLLKLLFF